MRCQIYRLRDIGRERCKIEPTHEYETAGAEPYFSYFGENAGIPGLGYFAYSRAGWLIIAFE